MEVGVLVPEDYHTWDQQGPRRTDIHCHRCGGRNALKLVGDVFEHRDPEDCEKSWRR